MQGATACQLRDLFAATEPICNDQCITVNAPYSGKQYSFTNFDRYVVMFSLKTKGSCHTTAARVEERVVKAQFREYSLFIRHLHDGCMMAMSMYHCLARHVRETVMTSLPYEKFAEKKRLL